MAKKNVQPANEEVEVIVPDTTETTATEETTTKTKAKKVKDTNKETKSKEKVSAKQENDTKKKDNKNSKNKNKKEKKSVKKRAAEIVSELKKVSKPTFGKVVKNTCVVIVVVAICTLLLFGMDRLFSLFYDLLLP